MVEWASKDLPLTELADVLSLSRLSLYYTPRPPDARELAIKHRIDALYTKYPHYGARRMAYTMSTEGLVTDRKTVRAYKQQMELEGSERADGTLTALAALAMTALSKPYA